RADRPRRADRQDRAQARDEGRRGSSHCRGRRGRRGRGCGRGRRRRGGSRRNQGVSAPPLSSLLPFTSDQNLVYAAVGVVVLLVFVAGAWFVSNRIVEALRRREVRADVVQVGARVATVVLIGLGIFFALGLAFQSQNFTLAGILLATIVASFGVQDVLKDYVSGYYVLLERHMRVGDRISMEGVVSGTVEQIKLRVTLLKNEEGDLVVVPNSELFNKAVLVHVRAAERVAETSAASATPAPPATLAKPAPPE